MKLFALFKNITLSKEERATKQNEKELQIYNRRQDKYNDMLRDETQKQKFLNNMNKIKVNTFTKKMVTIILTVCIIDIQLPYILAFFNKGQIVEELSGKLCTTILGVAFVYMIRAYFDSKAEHKNLDNKIKKELKDEIYSKIEQIFESSGININTNELFDDNDDGDFSGLHINRDDKNQDDE